MPGAVDLPGAIATLVDDAAGLRRALCSHGAVTSATSDGWTRLLSRSRGIVERRAELAGEAEEAHERRCRWHQRQDGAEITKHELVRRYETQVRRSIDRAVEQLRRWRREAGGKRVSGSFGKSSPFSF